MTSTYRLTRAQLTRPDPAGVLAFESTQELAVLDGVIGQKRAVEAVTFGLEMDAAGYNIFVTGEEGTGKSTIIRSMAAAHAARKPTPDDVCLVHNFDDPFSPVPLLMPAGTGTRFRRKMLRFIEGLKGRMPQIFEAETFLSEKQAIEQKLSDERMRLFKEAETAAARVNVGIGRSEQGYRAVALRDGQPMSQEAFDSLTAEEKETVAAAVAQVDDRLGQTAAQITRLEERAQESVIDLISRHVGVLIEKQMAPMAKMKKEIPALADWLDDVETDIADNMGLFMGLRKPGPELPGTDGQLADMTVQLMKRYQINILVSHGKQGGAPVIFDANPSFSSLFGKIEKDMSQTGLSSDFTTVQAGSLLKANNGYLIMEIDPLVMQPGVWEKLKTALLTRSLRMEDAPEHRIPGTACLTPLPVDLNVKVILLGSYETFRIIQGADSRFNKLFKVRADFDSEVAVTPEVMHQYAQFIAGACRRGGFLPFSKKAVGRVIESGCRMAQDQSKLSLRFGQVMGILAEADYWAKKDRARAVSGQHVEKALHESRFRHNLYEEKVHQGFADGTVLIDVKGTAVGQVNALAVYHLGDIVFGRPSRITAESYMGRPGIINIEHESNLSGETHDKGVMIIAGFLGRMFAQDYPLSVSVSITFEQSYSGVDGDSASSTELYAVLSSISGIPVDQGIAVTGSVNQKGQIQAIGGVNEKIEGFFDVCCQKGLTGRQGVLIPSANVKNLMLRKDVIRSVEKEMFHIYAVSTISQGISVLFGHPAGEKGRDGHYPGGTVFHAVQTQLKRFYDQSRPSAAQEC